MPKTTAPKRSTQSQTAAVNRYLTLLSQTGRPRGRRTREFLEARRVQIAEELASDDVSPVGRLELLQEAADVGRDLDLLTGVDAIEEAEAAFIEVGAEFATRKGIAYQTWRKVGVPADVLRRAGIPR